MKQENSMFSNRTKRIGSIASDTTLVSVFDLATAMFPAWELQLTWSTAGCFSTPSHLLLSLRKLLRGKPPHTAAGWILIPVLRVCIRKQRRTDGGRLICFRSYCQKKIRWSRNSHFFQLLCRGLLFAAEKMIINKYINQGISVFEYRNTRAAKHMRFGAEDGAEEWKAFSACMFWFSWDTRQKAALKKTAGLKSPATNSKENLNNLRDSEWRPWC